MSGSPGASDEANRVVYACLAALDLLEAGGEPLREKYPATGGLAAAFYGALRAVHGRARAGRGWRTSSRAPRRRGARSRTCARSGAIFSAPSSGIARRCRP